MSPSKVVSSGARSPDAPSRGNGQAGSADADALAHELTRLMRLVERVRADCAIRCGDGVDKAAYVLLAHLVADGPRRLSALAEAVHSDPSTVSRQVTHLVQVGMVERHADPQDGRAILLSATEAGRFTFAEHRRIRTEHTAALVARWPAKDLHRLVELLSRLSTDFEAYRAHLAAPAEPTEQEGLRS